MKTLACLLIVFFQLACFTSLNAEIVNDTSYTSVMPASVKQAIVSKIEYPEDARELKIEGIVTASITIGNDGRIIINQINGHPEFVKYISKQLALLNIDPKIDKSKQYIIRFKFELK